MAGTAKGKHSRAGYVGLVFAIHRGKHSGRLVLSRGRRSRELFFLCGRPVLYRSNLPEEGLAQTLVQSDVLPESRVKWIAEKLSPDERLEEALVLSGSLSEEQLEEHRLARTKPGVSEALSWNNGTWEFHALPAEFSRLYDTELLRSDTALASLWHGVSKHVTTDEVLPFVTDSTKGPLLLTDVAPEIIAGLGLPDSFADFQSAVGDGASVEDVFRSIPDSTGGLFKLIWMLECGGVVARENGAWDETLQDLLVSAAQGASKPSDGDAEPEAPKEASPPKKKTTRTRSAARRPDVSSSSGKQSEAWTEGQIVGAHQERMGCDFYAFLGIPAPSPRKDVDKACKELAQAWRKLDSTPGISSENRRLLKELLGGVQLVWRTLTDPKHKREYDRRLDMGRAPLVESRSTRSPGEVPPIPKRAEKKPEPVEAPESEPLEQAKSLIAQGKFKAAASVLESARMANPSDPAVLAELGWASWKGRKWGAEEDETAEEYLRLALTFEPQNTRAMEFLARIAIEKGQKDKAQQILKRIIKITSDSEWARTALLSLQKGHRTETVSRKRGFWRDKGSKP
ncbi:MAG: tetratricopeptide repeat protein [Myxococcota bacterium]|nr:tetratricopeptide repeat protein [Myxococcota bacterium]